MRAMGERLKLGIVLGLLCIYIVWGTTFFAIAVGVQTLPPFMLGAVRFLLAGGLLYAWLRWRSPRPFAGLPAGGMILSGLLYSAVGNGFLVWAQQSIPSGIAALVVASVPIIVSLIDWAAFSRKRPTTRAMLGIGIAGTGITLIVLQTQSFHGQTGLVYLAAILIAVIAWSVASLVQRDVVKPDRLLEFSAGQMLAGGAFQLLFMIFAGEWRHFDPSIIDYTSVLSVLYLALFGAILGQTTYFWLLNKAPTQYVTTYALVNPVVALFLGVVFLGEELTVGVALASLMVLLGVAVVLFQAQGPKVIGWIARRLRRA